MTSRGLNGFTLTGWNRAQKMWDVAGVGRRQEDNSE